MNVASLCKRAIVAVDAQCTLREAANAMLAHHVGAIVVTSPLDDRHDALGLVTDRDLAIACVAHALDPSQVLVGAIASQPLVSVLASSSAAQAADAMQAAAVRRLVVCEEDGQLLGLLSSDDLLAALIAPLQALAKTFDAGAERERARREAVPGPARQLFLPYPTPSRPVPSAM